MSTSHRSFVLLSWKALLVAALALPSALRSQCTYTWPAGSFGGGFNDTANCATVDASGDLIVGGVFDSAGGSGIANIARWDGSSWHALGSGVDGTVVSLVTLSNGDIIAGGSFSNAGGIPSAGVARWDGSSWSSLGGGLDPFVPFSPSANAVAELPNGDIVVGGFFSGAGGVSAINVARFDGAAWQPLSAGLSGTVQDLAVTPAGDLIAVGGFINAGFTVVNRVARWNGSSWNAMGSGLGIFSASVVAAAPSGDVYVGGIFSSAGGLPVSNIARFSSGSWSGLGSGTNGAVSALHVMPNNDLMVGGAFTIAGGISARRVARWDGSAWDAPGNPAANDTVLDVLDASNGDVVIVGTFTGAAGAGFGRIARISSSCGPQLTILGAGCSGSGGLNELTVTQSPVLGGALKATGTGMPTFAFVLNVIGLTTTSLPLSIALPQALPGCSLYANPDFVDIMFPSAGMVSTSLPVPNTGALVGTLLAQQFVPLEVDASLNFTQVTSTNGVSVTIGTF